MEHPLEISDEMTAVSRRNNGSSSKVATKLNEHIKRYVIHMLIMSVSVVALFSIGIAVMAWYIGKTDTSIEELQNNYKNLDEKLDELTTRLAALTGGASATTATTAAATAAGNAATTAAGGTTIAAPTTLEDCKALRASGITTSGMYHIAPSYGHPDGYDVYCDMETDGGGWIVFQRRQDGSVNFFRPWDDYKDGFRVPTGEFWLGNSVLHNLTSSVDVTLRVDLSSWDNETAYAVYGNFSIKDCNYELRVGSYLDGDAGDSLTHHHKAPFATYDNDHNENDCPKEYPGAWWYQHCFRSNLNGFYNFDSSVPANAIGVIWNDWKGYSYSLMKCEMKIRRTS